MNRHLFSLILSLCIILIFISFHIPTSLCADNEQYVNCSSSFKCGDIDITYPFWGAANRPQYCGYPGFELACNQSDDVLTINISTTSYRVLAINYSAPMLTVARQDYWNTYCPTSSLANATIDFNIFSYDSTSQNLSLYYGCPSAIGPTNQYSCIMDAVNTTGYYLPRELTGGEMAFAKSLGGSCNDSVKVSVFESAIETLNNIPTLDNVIKAIDGGFGLEWAANNTLCNRCDQSGGQCGYNSTGSGEFICYCADKPNYASTCGSGSSSGNVFPKFLRGFLFAAAGIILVFMIICLFRINYCKLVNYSNYRQEE